MDAIEESIRTVEGKRGSAAQWAERHLAAWRDPGGFELALKDLILGLDYYGRRMRKEFNTPPGQDSFLGPAFKNIAASIITLLNGSMGRFDGGTLDAPVRDICAENGVTLDGDEPAPRAPTAPWMASPGVLAAIEAYNQSPPRVTDAQLALLRKVGLVMIGSKLAEPTEAGRNAGLR